jgi:hypothetical protein
MLASVTAPGRLTARTARICSSRPWDRSGCLSRSRSSSSPRCAPPPPRSAGTRRDREGQRGGTVSGGAAACGAGRCQRRGERARDLSAHHRRRYPGGRFRREVAGGVVEYDPLDDLGFRRRRRLLLWVGPQRFRERRDGDRQREEQHLSPVEPRGRPEPDQAMGDAAHGLPPGPCHPTGRRRLRHSADRRPSIRRRMPKVDG